MNKSKSNIKIEVECDYFITKEMHLKILDALLKYILYQCQQIPVPMEVLIREIEISKTNGNVESSSLPMPGTIDSSKNKISSNDTMTSREEIKERLSQRRKELINQKYNKKRKRWLPKMGKTVNSYKAALSILQEELQKSKISSVIFALGSSPALARTVYKVCINRVSSTRSLGNNGKRDHHSISNIESLDKKILYGLFRAFTSSKELTEFVNGYFPTAKVWTLLQKEETFTNKLEKDYAANVQSPNLVLIPKMAFEIPRRAKVINIILNEKPTFCNNIIDMELTPCVGSIVESRHKSNSVLINNIVDRKRSKVSLFQSTEGKIENYYNDNQNCEMTGQRTKKHLNPKCMNCDNENCVSVLCTPSCKELEEVFPLENYLKPTEMANEIIKKTHNGVVHDLGSRVKSDTVPNGAFTPSPIKHLSKHVNSMNFNDYSFKKEFIWYQYQICIQGFKDLYLYKS